MTTSSNLREEKNIIKFNIDVPGDVRELRFIVNNRIQKLNLEKQGLRISLNSDLILDAQSKSTELICFLKGRCNLKQGGIKGLLSLSLKGKILVSLDFFTMAMNGEFFCFFEILKDGNDIEASSFAIGPSFTKNNPEISALSQAFDFQNDFSRGEPDPNPEEGSLSDDSYRDYGIGGIIGPGKGHNQKKDKVMHIKKSMTFDNKLEPGVDPGGEELIFYGTSRNKTGKKDHNDYYGNDLDELQVGTCIVNIPKGHKAGAIERPRNVIFYKRKENNDKDVTLSFLDPMNEADFYQWFRENINKAADKNSALIFVHGYNVSFKEAAWRTGQIAHDIPFNIGLTGFFSWPSTGADLDYGRDIELADASVSHLAKFIDNLVEKGRIKQLHFIAHSMGNRILTRALNLLATDQSFNEKIKVINQIVLAAPDIDQKVFEREIYPVFKSIGQRRTLYASDQDKALNLSKLLRHGLPRLGEGGENIYVADGIDTIDASNVPIDGTRHSYVFETDQLLTDIHLLFTQNLDPLRRRLRETMKQNLSYWFFREAKEM